MKAIGSILGATLCCMALSADAAERWAILTDSGERRASSVEFAADGASLVLKQADGASVSLPLRSIAALTHRAAVILERGTPPAAPGGAVLLAWAGVDDAIPPGMGAVELTVAVDGNMAQTVRLEAGGGLVPLSIPISTNAATVSFSAGLTPRGPAGSHVDLLYPCLEIKPQ